jgi:hypothetical protein
VPSTLPHDRRVHPLASWPRVMLAIVLGAATVAACGGGGTAAPTSGAPAATAPAQSAAPVATQATAGGGTVDVCALITTDEVAAILGKPVTIEPDTTSEDWAAGECWWNSATMDVRFVVVVGTPASIALSSSPTTQEQFDLFKISSLAPDPVDISGVGDAAAFGSLMLVTIRGQSMIVVFNLPQDQAEEIAKLVWTKLP